ncbi:putative TIM-barrel fold metal-dependent hydrolase [Salinibacterium sp. CAN_S4]
MVADAGLAFDLPDAWPHLLPSLPGLSRTVPHLKIVIDHLGKPPADSEGFAAWKRSLELAAEQPTTIVKLSGLSAAARSGGSGSVRRAWRVALDLFGPGRIAYGGDWPMTEAAGGYDQEFAAVADLVGELSPEEQHSIFYETAQRTYNLSTGATGGRTD